MSGKQRTYYHVNEEKIPIGFYYVGIEKFMVNINDGSNSVFNNNTKHQIFDDVYNSVRDYIVNVKDLQTIKINYNLIPGHCITCYIFSSDYKKLEPVRIYNEEDEDGSYVETVQFLEKDFGKCLPVLLFYSNKKGSVKININPTEKISDKNNIDSITCKDIVQWFNFNTGNAIRHIWRYFLKDEPGQTSTGEELKDLELAKQYIELEIEKYKKYGGL